MEKKPLTILGSVSLPLRFIRWCLLRSRVARWYVFKPKIQNWVNFGGPWNEKSWCILLPIELYYGQSVYFSGRLVI
jgi:hypothetical protein